MEIKIDRKTLPKSGQKIEFQTEDLNWHKGEFIAGDDIFLITPSKFHFSWHVLQWESIEKKKPTPKKGFH